MELFRQNPHLHHLQQPSISLLSDSTPLSGNAASLFMYQDINEPANKLKVGKYKLFGIQRYPNYTKIYQIFLNVKESAYPFILILTLHSTLHITDNELNMQKEILDPIHFSAILAW